MTLPEAQRLFAYWDRFPPPHEALAILLKCYTTWGPAETPEESRERQWKQGAMNPAEFLAHYKRTGGKVEGVGRT